MIALLLLTAVIAAITFVQVHNLWKWDPVWLDVIKFVAALIAFPLITGGGILLLLGLIVYTQAVSVTVRGILTSTKPKDNTSWWGEWISEKFGEKYTAYLVYAEYIIFLITIFL